MTQAESLAAWMNIQEILTGLTYSQSKIVETVKMAIDLRDSELIAVLRLRLDQLIEDFNELDQTLKDAQTQLDASRARRTRSARARSGPSGPPPPWPPWPLS